MKCGYCNNTIRLVKGEWLDAFDLQFCGKKYASIDADRHHPNPDGAP